MDFGFPFGCDGGLVTSVRNGRRVASPIRLTLACELGSGVDGAWWPHSASLARELPDLAQALEEPLGPVIDISVNWSPLEGVPDLDLINRRGVSVAPGREPRQLRVMTVTGARARAQLLVVPWHTTMALAVMVMRRAAALPILSCHEQTQAFQSADAIVCAARAQPAPNPPAESPH